MERIKRALDIARSLREPAASSSALSADTVERRTERALHNWRTPVAEIDPRHIARERILGAAPDRRAAAPYKLLRTQLLRRLEQGGVTSVAVISPRAHEGKTLTAINLAISIATDPNRTALLVDLDLRSPSIAGRFGIHTEFGFENCLREAVSLEQVLVRPRGYDRLTLLPACSAEDSSSELLGTARAGDIVTELRSRYTNRIVIFDMPPVLETDDVLAFSRHIQAALLVVSEGKTRREDITRTLQLLGDTPIVGTVLNGSRSGVPAYG